MSKSYASEFSAQFNDGHFPVELIDRYIPIELLAENDHSQTFLLQEKQGERLIVAKRYKKQDDITEDEILSHLAHPGLPVYLGKISDQDHTYILHEFVRGQSLDKYAQKPLPEKQAANIAKKLCKTLIFIHSQVPPVIHRDIKPSNIIVEPETEKVTLIDFGIARKYVKTAENDTVYMGTHRFSPPEQYGFSQTDNRADIYALGVLLYWMLTGETDVKNAKEGVRNSALRKIIQRCTAFDPNKRYKSAAILLHDLRYYNSKKKTISAIIAVAAVFVIFFAGFVAGRYSEMNIPVLGNIIPNNSAIVFGDPVLEQRIRDNMNKPEGDITVAEAKKVTKLDLSGSSPNEPKENKIRDITALAQFVNLQSLYLDWNEVSDIHPLAGLKNLEVLYLNGNGAVADFSPLQGLTKMKDIMFVGCNINDGNIVNCSQMSTLESFWVESKQLTDVGLFRNFKTLKKLTLKGCSIHDVKPIAECQDLINISLEGNPVSDLTPLLNLPNLGTLYLSSDQRSLAEKQLSDAQFTIEYK